MSKKAASKVQAKQSINVGELNFQQLKIRIEKVILRLDQLLCRVREKTALAVFLTELTQDFQFDLLTSSDDLKTLTLEDKLVALEEFERGKLCSQSFKKLRRRGMEVDLTTIMVR